MFRPLRASWAALVLVLGCTGSGDPFECDQSDSTVSCCLKKHPGRYEACGAEAPGKQRMLGERGPRINSKTLWRGKKGARLDVENPNPGVRSGQLHLQVEGKKYIYDVETRAFRDAPRWVNETLEDPNVARAIEKGRKYLGVP